MARALDAAGELHFHLLVGNHDQRSDARGDNALAVLASIPNVTVYERPTFTHLGDEPFLFVIRDTKTGLILFMGRVGDPTAK